MKLINLAVSMLLLAPMAVNAQSLSAGGNYRGVFGGGQTTATLEARVMAFDLNVTFEVSSRGDDGSMYNEAFAFNNVDGWSTRGGAPPRGFSGKAVAQASQAYHALQKRVQQSLNDKGRDLGIDVPFLPLSPFPVQQQAFFPDSERINIH